MTKPLPDHTPATLGDVRAVRVPTLASLIAAAEIECETCKDSGNGPGWVYSWEWAAFNAEMDALEAEIRAARLANGFHPGEQLTGRYGPHGHGVVVPSDVADLERQERDLLDRMPDCQEYARCDECDGSGRKLAGDGRALIELLGRHGLRSDR